MKNSHAYTDAGSNVFSDIRWLLSLDEQNVQVFCDGESRTYSIPEPVTDFKVEDEYVFIYVDDPTKKFYQFKFEFDKFLVGDIFDKDEEHLDSFACHVFGEDC